jgi:formylglycine-generating enzyme required for sulfatase activity
MATLVRLLSCVSCLAPAIAGFASDDDFDVEAQELQEIESRNAQVNARALVAAPNVAALRQQQNTLVSDGIQEVNRLCPLTNAQKQKLRLAGAGDTKRFLDRFERIRFQLELAPNDTVKLRQLMAEQAQVHRRSLNSILSDENSLFVKSLKSTLSADQFTRYQQLRAIVLAGGSVQAFQRGADEVVDVTLSGTAVADKNLADLCQLRGLHSLLLDDTRITDAGLAHLGGLAHLAVLRLDNTPVTDAGIEHLQGLVGLREISLDNTAVTDRGLALLAGLAELQWLSLGNTRVTAEGLVHLKGLKHLEFLDLAGTRVTDAGLAHLRGLTSLQSLDLERTQVTSAGLNQLHGLTGLVEVGFVNTTGQPAASRAADEIQPGESAADRMVGTIPGQVRNDNGLKIELVWCPGGFLKMGNEVMTSDAEALARRPVAAPNAVRKKSPVKVFLTHGFWLGKYEITQGEWKQLMLTTPWNANLAQTPEIAATFITWPMAIEFCRRLTDQERQAGRLSEDWEYTLPTEAQWERACRAGTGTAYSFGDDDAELAEYAWFRTNAQAANESHPHPVAQKKPNPWGLFDMHGNVREWCLDIFAPRLPGGRDPIVTTGGQNRVCRGGNYFLPAEYCRSSSRDSSPPNGSLAFRLALSPVRRETK